MNKKLLESRNLPIIESLDDFSKLTHLSSKLIFVLSKYNDRYYKRFKIRTNKNKERVIYSPNYSMKVLQLWILRNILEKIELSDSTMGFRSGSNYGIKANAEQHINNEFIMKVDIKDFFPSINRKQVFKIFNNCGYSTSISNILTDMCTLKNFLPQGAVTSPYLSNLVLYEFDKEIISYCSTYDVTYSRYADDLVFSSNIEDLLKEVYDFLNEKLKEIGFNLNDKKTKFMSSNNRQIITGIVINSGSTHIKRELKYKIRAMIYNDLKNNNKLSNRTIGYISFVKSIDPERSNYFEKYIEKFSGT